MRVYRLDFQNSLFIILYSLLVNPYSLFEKFVTFLFLFSKAKDMNTTLEQLDLSKTYTYADYLRWQFEERLELIKGRIFKMSPAPSVRHQRISSNLHGLIWSFLKNQNCRVFSAPFDVRLSKKGKKDDQVTTVV